MRGMKKMEDNDAIEFLRYHLMYHTKQNTAVNSFTVGFIYRLAQVSILFYIIVWELYWNKGYQAFEPVGSVITTKLKGYDIVQNEFGEFLKYNEQSSFETNTDFTISDATELVIPPINYNSLFVMTNFIKTEQHQGFCDEELKFKCQTDEDCIHLRKTTKSWHGLPSDKCVNSTRNTSLKVCQIKAWCPLEDDSYKLGNNYHVSVKNNIFDSIGNYSVLIRNNVEFKKFKKTHRNILPLMSNAYLSNCVYSKNDKSCPVFRIGDILESVEPNIMEREMILKKGGAIEIKINWDCDYDFTDECFPTYSFNRLDSDSSKTKTALGFNFRFANKGFEKNQEYRVLYKAYGIKLLINVYGTAGQFSIYPLITKIGAGIGLMGISVFIADFLALTIAKDSNCCKNKELNEDCSGQIESKEHLELVRI